MSVLQSICEENRGHYGHCSGGHFDAAIKSDITYNIKVKYQLSVSMYRRIGKLCVTKDMRIELSQVSYV